MYIYIYIYIHTSTNLTSMYACTWMMYTYTNKHINRQSHTYIAHICMLLPVHSTAHHLSHISKQSHAYMAHTYDATLTSTFDRTSSESHQ